MTKEQFLDKWMPRFIHTSILSKDFFEFCDDADKCKLGFDNALKLINENVGVYNG